MIPRVWLQGGVASECVLIIRDIEFPGGDAEAERIVERVNITAIIHDGLFATYRIKAHPSHHGEVFVTFKGGFADLRCDRYTLAGSKVGTAVADGGTIIISLAY